MRRERGEGGGKRSEGGMGECKKGKREEEEKGGGIGGGGG